MNNPLVSIILPVSNESTYIERVLSAILNQDYPFDCMEIFIIDGMSTDNTRAIIYDFITLHTQLQIHVLDNPGKIVSIGINIALQQVKGNIIIRVDGHTFIAPDYVRQCVEILQRSGADNVGGKMNAIGDNLFSKAVALATSVLFGVGWGRFHYSVKEEWVDTVYMGAWPRQVFEKIGLFDEELVRDQDDEFNYRLRKYGGRILLSPAIQSEYTVRSTTPGVLWKQYYQYGFWKVRVLQKHSFQMSLRQFVPPVFVLALLLSVTLLFIPVLRFLSPIVFLVYLFINLGISLWIVSKRSWQLLPFLLLIFAILHFSYGVGFLVGLLKFSNRWGDKQGKTPTFESKHA